MAWADWIIASQMYGGVVAFFSFIFVDSSIITLSTFFSAMDDIQAYI